MCGAQNRRSSPSSAVLRAYYSLKRIRNQPVDVFQKFEICSVSFRMSFSPLIFSPIFGILIERVKKRLQFVKCYERVY